MANNVSAFDPSVVAFAYMYSKAQRMYVRDVFWNSVFFFVAHLLHPRLSSSRSGVRRTLAISVVSGIAEVTVIYADHPNSSERVILFLSLCYFDAKKFGFYHLEGYSPCGRGPSSLSVHFLPAGDLGGTICEAC